MISPQVARELIQCCQPRTRLAGLRLPLCLASGVLIGALVANPRMLHLPRSVAVAVPLILALGIIVAARRGMRRRWRMHRQWIRVSEAIQLEEWATARQTLSVLLSGAVDNSVVRAQGLLSLAAVADHYHEHRSSQLIYEHVLGSPGALAVQLHVAAVGLATAMLRNEEITGAVRLIDRLARQDLPRPWKAHVELVGLFREVVMGQYDDVLATAEQRRALFRECLSTRSGYGYALLALGLHRRGQTERAGRLWNDATLLIRPEKLLDRFPMLVELKERYPACEALP